MDEHIEELEEEWSMLKSDNSWLQKENARLRAEVRQLTNALAAEKALSSSLRTQVDHLNSLAAIMSDPIFAEPQP